MFSGSKNMGGRPAKPTDERRSFSVTVKFNKEEMDTLKKAEEQTGIHRAALIRELVFKGRVHPRITREELEMLKEFLRNLRAIGTNINGIARMLNAGIGRVTTGQVEESLEQLRALAARYQNKLL